jgi:uncharacterized membrane protein YphA (DoxX/SURF4 family)
VLTCGIVLALLVIPREVIWSYCAGGAAFAIGPAAVFLSDKWRTARGFDKLILFGPVFYAAPLAAFGAEHFTLTAGMVSMVPAWIPWHSFWVYLVGACFIAASLSLATGIQTRLAASLLSLTFFIFAAVMDAPAWAQDPRDRFATALMLREIAFSGGALALAGSLAGPQHRRQAHVLAAVARYFVAVPILFYSFEQFLHAEHVPGVPLQAVTPTWIYGHSIWTYLTAVVYAVAGALLLSGIKTRAAATGLGVILLVVILAVYIPIGAAERDSLDNGLNYLGDTLMFCGAVLLLAGAMPHSRRAA